MKWCVYDGDARFEVEGPVPRIGEDVLVPATDGRLPGWRKVADVSHRVTRKFNRSTACESHVVVTLEDPA